MHPVTRINLGLILLIAGLWWIGIGVQVMEYFRGPISDWFAFFPFLVWFLLPGMSAALVSYGFLRAEEKQSSFYKKWIRPICIFVLSILGGALVFFFLVNLACPPKTWD